MDSSDIRAVANAVLYEGYVLYPYRPSALKNRSQGWSFGTLLPKSYADEHPGEPAAFHAEVLLVGDSDATISAEIRFLQLVEPGTGSDALERSIVIESVRACGVLADPMTMSFTCPGDGKTAEPACRPLHGSVKLSAQRLSGDRMKLALSVMNETAGSDWPDRDHALRQALVSAHAILTVERGEFISLLDPPEACRADIQLCRQQGVFPVLAGEENQHSAMLISPIILYDYPRIAADSHGDFFDSSEIDEMLTLRVLTLTDEEKREIGRSGQRARALLQRTQSLSSEDILKLHGMVRSAGAAKE